MTAPGTTIRPRRADGSESRWVSRSGAKRHRPRRPDGGEFRGVSRSGAERHRPRRSPPTTGSRTLPPSPATPTRLAGRSGADYDTRPATLPPAVRRAGPPGGRRADESRGSAPERCETRHVRGAVGEGDRSRWVGRWARHAGGLGVPTAPMGEAGPPQPPRTPTPALEDSTPVAADPTPGHRGLPLRPPRSPPQTPTTTSRRGTVRQPWTSTPQATADSRPSALHGSADPRVPGRGAD